MGGGTYSNLSATVATRSYREAFKIKKRTEVMSSRMIDEMDPNGITIRESRDSEEHPESIPIIVALDVTGSMGVIPQNILSGDLMHIMNGVIKSGIKHPQVMFMAIGDHISDYAPLQVGQFESSDQLLLKWLEGTYPEGRGGGTKEESYLLAWLIAGQHTSTDHFEKRGQKGMLFTVGDEMTHESLSPEHVEMWLGKKSQGYDAETLIKQAQEKYHVYHIHVNDGSYPDDQQVLSQWRRLLGDKNLMIANKHTDICHMIAVRTVASIRGASPAKPHEAKEDETEEML